MRIRELEEKSGVPRTTIHFYLRHGLLHPPRKTGRTMAYYDETHLQRLKTISQLKKGGRLPLSLLKEKVEAADDAPKAAVNAYDVRKIVATTREKEKKRAEIIKQAIVVFTRKGYHGTKIVDITGALNISTGTFYLYFRNKRDLFIEVIDNVFRNIVGEAAVAIKDETDFFRRLRIRGRVFYENYTRYNEVLNQLRAEMAGDDHWPEEKIKKIYHGLTEPVRREIERAVKEGILRPVDPDLAAYALTGLIEIMSLRISLDQKYNLDKIIDFIADLTLNGLLPMSRQSS